MPPQIALETRPAARLVLPKVLADNNIRPEIKLKNNEHNEDALEEKNKSI